MNNQPTASTVGDLANDQVKKSLEIWEDLEIKSEELELPSIVLKKEQLKQDPENKQPPSLLLDQTPGSCSYCKTCDKSFNEYREFRLHLLRHVQLPFVIIQRLNPSFVRRITSQKSYKDKAKKYNFARKRIRSYIEPLKLKLKKNTTTTTLENPTFEVVPRKILLGPGDRYPVNGGVLDEVKTEVLSQGEDVECDSRRVDGEKSEEEGVGVKRTSPRPFIDSENSGGNKSESPGQDESEEEGINGQEVTAGDSEDEGGEEGGGESPQLKQGLYSACPSPTPSEQLRPDFLPPDGGGGGDDEDEEEEEEEEEEEAQEEEQTENLHPSTMVEMNTPLAEASSPAFPTTSPAPPAASGDSNSQHSLPDQNQQSSPLANAESEGIRDGDQGTEDIDASENTFNWNEVAGSDPVSNAVALEERDPLMLPEQPPEEGNQGNAGNLSESNSSDSLLRGFLCDPESSEKGAIAVTTNSSGGSALDGLGSEYISLERLGETSALACCDVCGEKTSNLDEHRANAGHYKCTHPECPTQVFSSLNELTSHQNILHGGPPPQPQAPPLQQQQPQQQQSLQQPQQQYPIQHQQQTPPVQQLAQQVQRLPIPPQQLSPHQMNHQQPMGQQMTPQLHQLMPPHQQQQYPQSPVRRPPPLYRANMPGSPQNMQYPQQQQQQHMVPPQMYNQQQYQQNFSSPTSPMNPPRSFNNMQQMSRPRAPNQINMQRPSVVQQQQQPRMAMQQKRPAVGAAGGQINSPNKQRRMDVLIPDRHDDADCHVIAMQKRTDSGPVIGSVQGAANNAVRPESMIHLTDSITLSVRNPQGGNNANQNASAGGKNKSDAKAVANILATRGITVTPAGGNAGRSTTQSNSPQRQARPAPAPQPAPPPQPVTTLNLNSAISIIAQPTAASSRQQQGNFAVPHGRGIGRQQPQQQPVERPPRPPTVDLTGDGPPTPPVLHSMSRGRGRGRGVMGRHTCQVCDKAFSTLESLNQHMALHRSPGKLPFRCSLCPAQYPTQQGLLQHRQTYHKEPAVAANAELAIPVVDMRAPGCLNRLASLGIHQYIPLSQLGQGGNYFGLPIVSVDGARNPNICNLAALGAPSVLSLGPLRYLNR